MLEKKWHTSTKHWRTAIASPDSFETTYLGTISTTCDGTGKLYITGCKDNPKAAIR